MADKKKKQRCYLYLRVSTEIQVEGYSLDAQRERLIREANYRDMQVVEEFKDEGKSGKNTTGRPAFQEMMDRIKNGNPDGVDYVLVFKLSRFGRNTADVLSNLQAMQDNEVNLISVDEGINSAGAAGKLMISVIAAVAEIERDNIRVQTTAGRRQKAREGSWNGGPAPLGYKVMKDANGRNGRLVVDEDEARLVRLIFDKYAHTSMGYSGVAKWLNKNGYRRPVPSNGKYSVFTDLTVKNVLDNPVYTGKIVHGRYGLEKVKGARNEYRRIKRNQYEVYGGMHEAIIPDELWDEVQAKRQATTGKPQDHFGPKHVHVLSGIVRCPECGLPMYGNTSGRKKNSSGDISKPIFYYSCKHAKRNTGKDCTYTHSIREELLDKQVVKVVQQAVNSMYVEKGLIMALGNSEDLDELTANLDTLRAERKTAEKKKSRLLDRIERLDVDSDQYDTMFHDLQGVLQRYNQSIAELDDQIEDASIRVRNARDGAASFEETLRMFHQSMGSIESWPVEHLRAFMHKFLEYVEIFPNPLPGGQLVRRIRFKFAVSVDGGLTYSDIIDMDPGDGDNIPPDDDPPPGDGGGSPKPEAPSPGEGVFLTEDILLNPNVLVLIGDNTFKWKFVERDEELISMLIELESAFWHHVQDMTPPPLDGSDASAKFLSERFHDSIPKSHITLPDTAADLLAQYDEACEELETVTERKQKAENLLKEMMGENEVGTAGDHIVTWKSVSQERLDSKTLKAEHPALCKKYTNKTSYRRFTIKAVG